MEIKNKKGLIILSIIAVVAFLSVVFSMTEKLSSRSSKNEVKTSRVVKNISSKKDYVAALYVEGVITSESKLYNQKWIMDKIDELKNDSKNAGIILFLNTPGGGVYQSDEVYLALLDYKKATDRPVYAYMGPLAASGGYYIACAADKIYANRNTLTGSIGVIAGSSVDATELLSKIGVKSYTITAGKNKNMFNYNQPLTEEQRAIMQSVADDAYEQFTGIVAQSRKKTIEDVKTLADGRIYTANQAKANGLIDDICQWDEAVAKIKEAVPEDDDVELVNCRYEEEFNLKYFMKNFSTLITNPSAYINQISDAVLLQNNLSPSYLYIN